LPFFSAIPAGRADWAEAEPDRQVAMEPGLFGLRSPDRAFVVKVRGRSMEGAGIRDGDLAVLEKKEPREGDVVAALVDGEVTLKRLVTERKGWFLKSENPEYPDLIPRRDLQVQGVLVGLVRRWKS
jgi:repressor LexA